MINPIEARIDVLLTSALDELAVVKRVSKLLDIALEENNLERVHVLVECFQAYLDGSYADASINVSLARKELKDLLKETE